MDYGDITANFNSLLNRRDCTAAQTNSFLQNGIQKIQRELRCPAMEKQIIVTIDGTYSGGLVIPSDFLELQWLMNSQGTRITKEDMTRVQHLAGGFTNQPAELEVPRFYVRLGPKWLLGPTPASGDTVTVLYYANIPDLILPTDTCTLTKIAGDLFVYGGLVYAGDFYTDKRSDKWEQRYEQIKGVLQSMADADELTGGTDMSPAIDYPDDHYDDF